MEAVSNSRGTLVESDSEIPMTIYYPTRPDDEAIQEKKVSEIEGGSHSTQDEEVVYPTGIRLALIVSCLASSVFLVALVEPNHITTKRTGH